MSAATEVGLVRRVPRFVATALGGAVVIAVVIGVPTDLIDTPLFSRDVPATWWSRPVWIVSAVLSGVLVATYAPWSRLTNDRACVPRLGSAGGLIGFFAVGCPVCNKVVLLLLGASGAMTYFEPVQPLLAAISLVLLIVALVLRLRPVKRCPTPRSSAV